MAQRALRSERKVQAYCIFRVAVHEAGHIVACIVLGFTVNRFSFTVSDEGIEGEPNLSIFHLLKAFLFNRKKFTMFKMAGYAAELAVFGQFDPISQYDNHGIEDIDRAVEKTLPLIKENLDRIIALARWICAKVGHENGRHEWTVYELPL